MDKIILRHPFLDFWIDCKDGIIIPPEFCRFVYLESSPKLDTLINNYLPLIMLQIKVKCEVFAVILFLVTALTNMATQENT